MKLKEKYDKITNAEAKSSDISKSKEYLINKVKELSSKGGKSMRKIIDIYNAPLISESSKIVYYVILLFLKPTEKKGVLLSGMDLLGPYQ